MLKSFETFITQFNEKRWIFFLKFLLVFIVILDYLLTTNIDHVLGNWFYVLPVSALVLTSLPLLRRWQRLHTHGVLIIIYNALVALFLILLTSVFGPYFQFLILALFAAVHWYGWKGLFASLFFDSLVIAAAIIYQYSVVSSAVIYSGMIHWGVLLAVGILFTLVHLGRKEGEATTHQLNQTISFERTRLVSLINSMADAVIATDNKGLVVLYNGAALSLMNTNASLEKQPLSHFMALYDEHGQHVDVIAQTDKENRTLKRDDLHFISNENQQVDVALSVSPIRSNFGLGHEAGFIIVARDITKEKTLDEERNEFISVTSHELRTPIAIAEANISTALHPSVAASLKPEIRELLEQAHHNIIFLGDLVNDLTTLARAERGDLDINIKLVDPGELISQLALDYKEEAKAKGLEIVVNKQEGVKALLTSELYIREVLQNFITNALKYTEKGRITLGVVAAEHGGVKFSVQDSGIGISASDRKNIFSKFYRSEDYRTRQTRGTGLGLYITLKLAERVRGKIWFDSVLNKGSTFYLQVPPIGALKKDHRKVAKEEIKDFARAV